MFIIKNCHSQLINLDMYSDVKISNTGKEYEINVFKDTDSDPIIIGTCATQQEAKNTVKRLFRSIVEGARGWDFDEQE